MTWDPEQYLRFSDQRALPFQHLVAAVGHLKPAVVVDLDCGPGGLTATLRPVLERLPEDEHEEFLSSTRTVRCSMRRTPHAKGRQCSRSRGLLWW